MANLSWSLTLQVSGSPTFAVPCPPIAIEATDRLDIAVEPGTETVDVDIQPGEAKAVRLLLITSSDYGDNDHRLRFKVSDGNSDSDELTLNGPQIFSGGSVALFRVAPKKLKFVNKLDKPAKIEIFVARDATP